MTYDEALRLWRILLVRGVAATIFGFVALVWPDITLTFLVILFGAFALLDGIAAISEAFMEEPPSVKWPYVGLGVLGVFVGIVTLVWPGITALTLLYIIAFWAIAAGVAQLMAAIRLRQAIENEWILAISGVLSVAFGVIVAIFPGAGAISIVWVIGVYAMAFGFASLLLAWRLRRLGRQSGGKPVPAH
jgi:uncharacterized membrane protein HdeD (DUF308 family)